MQEHSTRGVPPIVYHYTNDKGALGIAGSQVIYATRLSELNDSTEFLVARWLGHAFLVSRLDTAAYGWSRKARQYAVRLLGTQAPEAAYVSAFTVRGDDLSQWRGYAGIGWALGFDGPALQEAASSMEGWSMVECLYGPGGPPAELVLGVLTAILDDPTSRTLTEEQLGLSLAEAIWGAAPRVKHEGFAAESEWRLVFEGRDSSAEPKTNFPLPSESLLSLRKGPGRGRQEVLEPTDPVPAAFLASHLAAPELSLELSYIPWKGWRESAICSQTD